MAFCRRWKNFHANPVVLEKFDVSRHSTAAPAARRGAIGSVKRRRCQRPRMSLDQ
jgi:hypothetical protein